DKILVRSTSSFRHNKEKVYRRDVSRPEGTSAKAICALPGRFCFRIVPILLTIPRRIGILEAEIVRSSLIIICPLVRTKVVRVFPRSFYKKFTEDPLRGFLEKKRMTDFRGCGGRGTA